MTGSPAVNVLGVIAAMLMIDVNRLTKLTPDRRPKLTP